MKPQRCIARSATSRGLPIARANPEAEKHHKTLHDTSVILDIVGPALANAMPPSYFELENGMRAHTADNGGLVPRCAIPTCSSTVCVNALVNFRVSHVVTVLRTLVRGDRKFIGDHIAEIAEIESRAPRREQWRSVWVALLVVAADNEQAFVSRIASYQNLGGGDKQTEEHETSIDLKEYKSGKDVAPLGRRRFFYVRVQAHG